MIRAAARLDPSSVLRRLGALAPLDGAALSETRILPPRQELLSEGAPVPGKRLLVYGWAARARLLAGGRRQFLSFVVPGDLIGFRRHPQPLAASTVVTLTEVGVCPAPAPDISIQLRRAYAVSQAFEEAYLLDQITRLGRLNAQERIISLLLELHERLARAGLVHHNGFGLPLTQETLADALGLTAVHVNRMLQQARRDGDLTWRGGQVMLRDPVMLGRRVNRPPVKVSSLPG